MVSLGQSREDRDVFLILLKKETKWFTIVVWRSGHEYIRISKTIM